MKSKTIVCSLLIIIAIISSYALYRVAKNAEIRSILVSKGIIYAPTVKVVPNSPTTQPVGILARIAECESGNRQFNPDGTVFHGAIDPLDTGKYQINTKWWGAKAKALGFNLDTLQGNTEMAEWIYARYGSKPWTWSEKCWTGE